MIDQITVYEVEFNLQAQHSLPGCQADITLAQSSNLYSPGESFWHGQLLILSHLTSTNYQDPPWIRKIFFEKSQGFKSYFQKPGIKASQNFIPRVYRLSLRNKAKGQLNGLLQQHIPVRETSAKHGIIDSFFFPSHSGKLHSRSNQNQDWHSDWAPWY